MNLIMLGTGGYAVPTFRTLCESPHEVRALFTRPNAPRASKRGQIHNPMRKAAEQLGVRVFDPEEINAGDAHELLRPFEPDLLVVCDYGQILSPETLALSRHGGFNLHASLLPKYRGAAPINWALYRGETETGNTVIHMTPRLDAGPCVAQEPIAIGPNETADQLEPRMANSGAKLVLQAVDALEAGILEQISQDDAQASRARRLRKTDGRIDWTRTAEEIRNQIRALKPWPKTYTHWLRPEGEPLRLIVDSASIKEIEVPPEPGTIVAAAEDQLLVATGDGVLGIDKIQPAGKRVLSTEEFLRGYPVQPGDRFDSA